jgi:hypothetical protein
MPAHNISFKQIRSRALGVIFGVHQFSHFLKRYWHFDEVLKFIVPVTTIINCSTITNYLNINPNFHDKASLIWSIHFSF